MYGMQSILKIIAGKNYISKNIEISHTKNILFFRDNLFWGRSFINSMIQQCKKKPLFSSNITFLNILYTCIYVLIKQNRTVYSKQYRLVMCRCHDEVFLLCLQINKNVPFIHHTLSLGMSFFACSASNLSSMFSSDSFSTCFCRLWVFSNMAWYSNPPPLPDSLGAWKRGTNSLDFQSIRKMSRF